MGKECVGDIGNKGERVENSGGYLLMKNRCLCLAAKHCAIDCPIHVPVLPKHLAVCCKRLHQIGGLDDDKD